MNIKEGLSKIVQNGIIQQNWELDLPYRILVYRMCSLFPSGILKNIQQICQLNE
jgi:hypothetical protein